VGNLPAADRKSALSGIRVLDLTRVLSGPWASQLLGDLGAEVIKVERPGTGDEFRRHKPHLRTREGKNSGQSALFLSTNRNKKSITLDITSERGRDIVLKLAQKSDVLLENFKAGQMARYCLDYDTVRAVNPGIVYCSISGFGQSGPYASRPGYDSIFQAISGMMSLTGQPDELEGGGPLKTGPSVSDIIGGMYGAFAVVAALRHRDQSGKGQYIDVSMLDATVALISHYAMAYLVSGRQPQRTGNDNPASSPVCDIRCEDMRIMISAGGERPFKALCKVLGRPELADEPRFLTSADRVEHHAELKAEIEKTTGTLSAHRLLAALEAQGIPCAPINDLPRAFEDPQIQFRNLLLKIDHPLSDSLRMVANPIRFSETPVENYVAPPLLGEHTQEVLAGLLKMDAPQIEELRRSGVV
jgi:crotonobetainyl-CoA:carnitine CoA-transferase CaiB-like acyl-CoA transferase